MDSYDLRMDVFIDNGVDKIELTGFTGTYPRALAERHEGAGRSGLHLALAEPVRVELVRLREVS